METTQEAIAAAPEAFAQTLLNLADQLDAPPEPAAEPVPDVVPDVPVVEPVEDSYEPPALDESACRKTFAVLNPQCRREYLEQFRALRTRLCLEQRNWSLQRQDLRVVSVLSPSAGDGRSFVAANLAASLAVSDAQVLLVDVNTASPGLHRQLGAPAEPGLTEALQGPRGLANQAWWTVLHRVPGCNLFVMTLGAGGATAIDTVDLQKLPSLIEHWRQCFDWVILDGPAFSESSDAEILSEIADASLLVIRPGHTRFAEAQKATARTPEGRVLGIVLNPRSG
ncbi:MAG: CpsD/CapB family tyrosine-protein kinase [Bryobacteraceae bacterium]|nr:CpsD/CapB family tyrosine-protein kinase [Bryobacteraceae bacterium]